MWARARYHLRLTSEEFWRLTPRQYHLLWEEHREHLIYGEMLQGWTTAAVWNSAPFTREAKSALDFMPSHRESKLATMQAPKPPSVEQQRDRNLFAARVAQAAAELRKGGGSYLDRLKQGKAE